MNLSDGSRRQAVVEEFADRVLNVVRRQCSKSDASEVATEAADA